MKLNWFVCVLLFIGGCQKTPTKPILKTIPSNTSSIPYNDSIQKTFDAKSMSKLGKLAKLHQLKQEMEALNCCDISLAFAYRRIGNLYNDLGQPDSAIVATKTALGILQKSSQQHPSDAAKCQLNIGVYHLLADYSLDSAKAYLESALFTFQKLEDSSSIFNAQNNLIRLHTQLGDYEQATLIEKSIQSFANHPKISNAVRKDWHSNLGLKSLRLLEAQEDTSKLSPHKQQILSHYNEAIRYLSQQNTMDPNIAAMLINISAAYIHSEDFYNAQKVLNQALLISKQAKKIVNEAKCLNNLSLCTKQPAIAKPLLLNADKLLSKLYNDKPNIYRTEIYSNLGNLDFEQKNYLKATDNYQKAIEHACSGNKDFIQQLAQQKAFNFNAPSQLLYPLQRKAEALFQQYLLDKNVDYLLKSLKIYETLDDYITRTRGLMTADESKFAYSEKVILVYEKALLAAFTAYHLDSKRYADYIIRFMAHSKAAVLQESAQQDTAKRLANIAPQSLESEKALRWEVAQAQKELSSSDSIQAPNAYKNLLKATQKWDAFIQQLEKQYPIYYHSKYAGLKVLAINQLQKFLTKDRAVIDFFWGQKTLYTTTMTYNSFQIDSMTITPVLQQQMDAWVKALHAEIVNDSVQNQLAQYSHRLYQQLLEKPLQSLPTQNKIQRITLIPDGILNRLPFEALCQKPIQTWLKKDTSAALIWKYAISYAYSNTLLFGAPKEKTNANKEFGGFGIGYKRKYVNESADKKASGVLRNAESDVVNARKGFSDSQIWTESAENAHLESFYKNAPDCRILYLSMHGVLNDSFPLQSGLIFTKKDSLQMLQLPDIQGLPLPYNDLTILSACNTSLGKLRHGEGLISLSRAFSFTGAQSLLTTRWSLDEIAGSVIIEDFLKYIKQGEPKDIALQKAKQIYLKTHQANALMPNLWAATVLVGDIEPLSQPNSYWIWIIVGFIFLMLIWKLRKS